MAEKTEAKRIGDMGESIAAELLRKKGYMILERNYRTRFGEIDIIAADSEYIVFAEVKTRNTASLERPAAFVDLRKQKKLLRTASIYLEDSDCELQPRFDVIEIEYDKITKIPVRTEHIENAFIQTDDYSAF